jgi:hypothetical protein
LFISAAPPTRTSDSEKGAGSLTSFLVNQKVLLMLLLL